MGASLRSCGAMEGADGGGPTSRGPPPAAVFGGRRGGGGWKRWSCACGGGGGMMTGRNCARGATLPCPDGARGAAGVRRRRCLPPVGQRRCCVARLILAGLRGKARCGAVCLSGRAGRRAGRTGAGARSRQGMDIHVLRWACRLMGENAPLSPLRRPREDRLAALPATAIFPAIPRGNGGLCPHPPKGPVPWVSLFGNGLHLPRLPHPPKRRRRRAPARGPGRRLLPPLPQPNRNVAPKPPARGAWVRRPGAEGAGSRHCRRWLPTLSGTGSRYYRAVARKRRRSRAVLTGQRADPVAVAAQHQALGAHAVGAGDAHVYKAHRLFRRASVGAGHARGAMAQSERLPAARPRPSPARTRRSPRRASPASPRARPARAFSLRWNRSRAPRVRRRWRRGSR